MDDDRIPLCLGHFCEGKTEFFHEQRARYLDETQIGDVRHYAAAIGIEKHYLHFCADAWHGSGHNQQSSRKPFVSNANRWSIGILPLLPDALPVLRVTCGAGEAQEATHCLTDSPPATSAVLPSGYARAAGEGRFR